MLADLHLNSATLGSATGLNRLRHVSSASMFPSHVFFLLPSFTFAVFFGWFFWYSQELLYDHIKSSRQLQDEFERYAQVADQ